MRVGSTSNTKAIKNKRLELMRLIFMDGKCVSLLYRKKNKNELSKTFSQWLTITKYHPSIKIRADTIFCCSQKEFEDTKGAIINRKGKRFLFH